MAWCAMAPQKFAAIVPTLLFVQSAVAYRTDAALEEDNSMSAGINWAFSPPSPADFENLQGWDPWWLPDFMNAVLTPRCGSTEPSGLSEVLANKDFAFVPKSPVTPLKPFNEFMPDTAQDEEGLGELKAELCEPPEEDEDEEQPVDGLETPATDCPLFFTPGVEGGWTGWSDFVISCKVVPKDASASAQGLLEKAIVDHLPAGWWQEGMLAGEWKRWFISGYASMEHLEGYLYDPSVGQVILNAAMYSLPTPVMRSDHAATSLASPLQVDSAPTGELDFGELLSKGQRPVEFESIYTPRRGSLQHAAEMNKNEDIVLLFAMPLAVKKGASTPYCDAGWGGLTPDGREESILTLQNMLRPLWKTNCQYYDTIAAKDFKDWYGDVADPRRMAYQGLTPDDDALSPEQRQAWEHVTCPCALAECKFENWFESQCPDWAPPKLKAKKAKPAMKKSKKWLGRYADQREKLKGCVHEIKRQANEKAKGWALEFQHGVWSSAPDKEECEGADSIKTETLTLMPTKRPTKMVLGKKKVLSLSTKSEKTVVKIAKKTAWVKLD